MLRQVLDDLSQDWKLELSCLVLSALYMGMSVHTYRKWNEWTREQKILNERLKQLEDPHSAVIHSPTSLRQLAKAGQLDNSKRYLVSGLLQQFPERGNKSKETDDILIREFVPSHRLGWAYSWRKIEKDLQLVDEKRMELNHNKSDFQNPIIKIGQQDQKHVRIFDSSSGLPRSKKDKTVILSLPFYLGGLSSLVLNFLSFTVQEDSSVTLFGMFKYDSGTDTFHATKLCSIYAGGISEIKRTLSEKIQNSQLLRQRNLGVALFCASISIFLTYCGLRRALNFLKKHFEVDPPYKKIKEGDLEQQNEVSNYMNIPECMICMENVADVVLTPCNHMLMCQPCFRDLKELQNSTAINQCCPVCRREIRWSSCFTLNKKTTDSDQDQK